jgi:hypothetical protein
MVSADAAAQANRGQGRLSATKAMRNRVGRDGLGGYADRDRFNSNSFFKASSSLMSDGHP